MQNSEHSDNDVGEDTGRHAAESEDIAAAVSTKLEVDLNRAFFPVKGNPHKMVLVKQPMMLFAKALVKSHKERIGEFVEAELDLGTESATTCIVDVDVPKVPRKARTEKRKEKKRTRKDDDGESEKNEESEKETKTKKTKKPTNCKWCIEHNHADSEGHNARGCKRRKKAELHTSKHTSTVLDGDAVDSADAMINLQSATVCVAAAE